MAAGKPPFHAEHIGSLIRPQPLRDARIAWSKGNLPGEVLHELEDRYIRDAVALQERAGLLSITDGEFRRETWAEGFQKAVDGYSEEMVPGAFMFTMDDGKIRLPRPTRRVAGKLKRRSGIVTEHFAFLKDLTKRVPKVTVPSTSQAYVSGGPRLLEAAKSVYPDRESYMADVAAIYCEELQELSRMGCTYVQIDEVSLAVVCDPKNREIIRQRGESPEEVIDLCIRTLASVVNNRPAGMTVCLHMCRGNVGQGMASGGYEPVAERLFNDLDVDGFFLEYDTPRAGDFQPLRHVPKGKLVALGLVSTKKPETETLEELRRRIDEAAQFIDLEQLGLCPQCGFGTIFDANVMTIGDQEKKLSRIVEVAQAIWGTD